MTTSKSSTAPRRAPSGSAFCDVLEQRVLFAAVFPTPNEQYLLELVNRARANPTAEVQRATTSGEWPAGVTPDLNEGLAPNTIDATARQPLAMNPFLLDAGRKHTQYLFATPNNANAHLEVVNGVTVGPAARMIAAGYPLPATNGDRENIWTVFGNSFADNPLDDMRRLEQQTFVDYPSNNAGTPGRGHRLQLLDPSVNEVGLGLGTMVVPSGSNQTTEYVVTQDYANANQGSFLCGVSFQDTNNDQFYEPGEELANVTITATRTSDNQVFSTTTWSSGGYSLKLDPGTYTVTATGGNIGTPAPQTVTIGTQNVETNFIAATAALSAPTIVTQPQNVTPFTNATTFAFTLAATGNPTPTVQWQVAPFQSTTFTDIAGATGFTYSAAIDKNLNGNQYRAVLTNSQGTVTSNPGNLTVLNGAPLPITITTRPQDQTVNAGDVVTFTAAATGYTSVSWQVLTPDKKFANIPGATTPTLTFTADPSMSGNQYYVNFNNSTGGTSVAAKLTVSGAPAAPTVTAQPQPQTAPNGGSATLTTDATGFPTPDVQWQTDDGGAATPALGRAKPAPNWQNISGGTGMTLTVPASSANGKHHYRAVISNGEGSVTTAPVTVTANKRSVTSNDLTSLKTATKAALAAIEACKRATNGVVARLGADLRRLKAARSATAQLNALAVNERNARANFKRNEAKVLANLQRAAARAVRDSARLKHHAGDAKIAAQLQADLTALQTAADSNTAPADATNCKVATADALAPLSAVAPTDLRLQNDIVAAQTNAYAIGQSLQAPMSVALSVASRLKADASL